MSTPHSTAPVPSGNPVHPPTSSRAQSGWQIATSGQVRQKGGLWLVPSQSGEGTYTVDLAGTIPQCTCPNYGSRRVKCKHIFAVEYTIRRETKPDGTTTVTRPSPGRQSPRHHVLPIGRTGPPTTLLRPMRPSGLQNCYGACAPGSCNRHSPGDGPGCLLLTWCLAPRLRSMAPSQAGVPSATSPTGRSRQG